MSAKKPSISGVDIFWALMRKHPLLLSANALFLVLTGLCEAVSVIMLSPVFDLFAHPDGVGVNATTEKILFYTQKVHFPPNMFAFFILFLFLVVLKNTMLFISRYLQLESLYTVMKTTLMDTFKRIFDCRFSYFSGKNLADLTNFFTRELLNIGGTVGSISAVASLFVRFLAYLAVPFTISPKLTLGILFMFGLLYLPSFFVGRVSRRFGKRNIDTANGFMRVIQESLSAAKTILGLGLQKKSVENLNRAFMAHKDITIKTQLLSYLNHMIYEPVMIFILFSSVYWATREMGISLTETIVMGVAFRSAMPLFSQFILDKNTLQSLIPSYEAMLELNEESLDHLQNEGGKKFEGLKGEITFSGVDFHYAGRAAVFKGLNLKIAKGQMTALVGKSGAGKTTVIDLILGLFRPNAGHVFIDGNDLGGIDVLSFRKRIGLVFQDNFLFNSTIRENLLWSYEEATEEDLKWALEKSNCLEFVDKLEKGLDTFVGDRGVMLSGGQRQRLALARAIIRRPEILILDEATSALDNQSERLIQDSIEELSKDMTIIVIAHRLSTIERADQIHVFNEGKVVESGTFPELMNKRGKFFEMSQTMAHN